MTKNPTGKSIKSNQNFIITLGVYGAYSILWSNLRWTGYRLMHGSILDLMDKVDGVLLHRSIRGPDYL